MIKTDYIISKIEKYASLELSEPWDNSGWQINLGHDYTNKIKEGKDDQSINKIV